MYENISNSSKIAAGSFRNNFYKKITNIKNKKILLISQYRDQYKNNENHWKISENDKKTMQSTENQWTW